MATTAGPSERKSYEQVCPMATALDLVGDRWTILILRELLGGPARFQDLRYGLPGIAPNLLTDRLRRLETDGIVRRVPSGGTVLYTVSDAGEAIRTAIEELGLWGAGMERVGPARYDRSIRAIAMALQSALARAGGALPDRHVTIELEIDGEFVEIALGPNPTVIARPAMNPDARVRVPSSQVTALLGGASTGATATHIFGDPAATEDLLRALGASVELSSQD